MLKANIEAQIDCKRNERQKVQDEIFEIDKTIRKLKERTRKLLDMDSDLYYDIQELEDMLK